MQFELDLKHAKSVLTELFSAELSKEFDTLIYEGQYDKDTIVDDIEDENDSNIIDGLQIKDEAQLKLFCNVIIQIFKYHDHRQQTTNDKEQSPIHSKPSSTKPITPQSRQFA